MFKAMEAVKLLRVCRSLALIAETNGIAWHHSHVRGSNPAFERRGMHSSSIPEDASVVYLRNGENGADVYLVGTCHVSEKSAQQVKQVALEECKRMEAQLLLIDDDIEVTIGKLVDVLSFSVVLRLFKAGTRLEEMVGNVALEDAIESFSERGFARKVMEIMTIESPEIMKVLITHRDQVMFKHLRSCQGKVVGVVGMGHMDGIEKMWKDADQKALNDNT